MNPRKLLFTVLACLACAPVVADSMRSASLADAGLTLKDFPRWQMLAPGVHVYEGLHSPVDGVDFNTVSLIVVGDEGVVLVDGQGDDAQSGQLVDYIRKLTDKPLRYVVVASDHGDHTGGNAAIRAAWPQAEFLATKTSANTLAARSAAPLTVVSGGREIDLGNQRLQLLDLGRAHTGGDLAVYLPDSKILFMSEIYLRGLFPAMRTGYPSEWVAAIDKALAMDVSWHLPGHGFIDEPAALRSDLLRFRESLVHLIAEGRRLHAAGYPCAAARDCPAFEHANFGVYATWPAYDSQAPLALSRVYMEIDGKLP